MYAKESTKYFAQQYWNGLNKEQKANLYMKTTPVKHTRDPVVVVNFANSDWHTLGGYNQTRFRKFLLANKLIQPYSD
jgi:hypothetical protein